MNNINTTDYCKSTTAMLQDLRDLGMSTKNISDEISHFLIAEGYEPVSQPTVFRMLKGGRNYIKPHIIRAIREAHKLYRPDKYLLFLAGNNSL